MVLVEYLYICLVPVRTQQLLHVGEGDLLAGLEGRQAEVGAARASERITQIALHTPHTARHARTHQQSTVSENDGVSGE